jgi:hypothetical protein
MNLYLVDTIQHELHWILDGHDIIPRRAKQIGEAYSVVDFPEPWDR